MTTAPRDRVPDTRLYDSKDYFTIYDFVKAHHHFSDPEWDGEPIEAEPRLPRRVRSAVRNVERAGVSRSVAMKLTGHKTEAVYRRYAIASAADLSEGVAELAVLHAAPQGSPSVLPFAKGTISSTIGRLGGPRALPKELSKWF